MSILRCAEVGIVFMLLETRSPEYLRRWLPDEERLFKLLNIYAKAENQLLDAIFPNYVWQGNHGTTQPKTKLTRRGAEVAKWLPSQVSIGP